jgi:hypothetical protein
MVIFELVGLASNDDGQPENDRQHGRAGRDDGGSAAVKSLTPVFFAGASCF